MTTASKPAWFSDAAAIPAQTFWRTYLDGYWELRPTRVYRAVSAAKAALESYTRQLALELGPRGITANALLAGVTDTPALRAIPGNRQLKAQARLRNPAASQLSIGVASQATSLRRAQ